MDRLWVFIAVVVLAPAQAGEYPNLIPTPENPLTRLLTQELPFQG